jgi:GNAT superfamily N-acetyltransferase
MLRPVSIRRYLDVERNAKLDHDLDAIFFEASTRKSFADDAERSAFRERWLGRYLRDDPRFAYLAMSATDELVGYLVGSVYDPRSSSKFADIGYFAEFRELTAHYPAHLHVNVRADCRGFGIGARLIDAFAEDARQAGAPGVHVVTSAASDNVRFYQRNGFSEAGRSAQSELVFLARKLP